MKRLDPPIILFAVVVSLVAGCGDSPSAREPADEPPTPATTAEAAAGRRPTGPPALRVGLVTDVGDPADRSWNALAIQGLERAESELGVAGRVLRARTQADYAPSLTALARGGYDLVIGGGARMAEAVEAVAGRWPDVEFAIVDVSQAAMASKPQNVRGLLFEEQEAGYLVGYLAGLAVEEAGGANPTVSSVGGRKLPQVDRYIAGFQAGARAASPRISTLNDYSRDFVDQAKCKEIALDQISRGSTGVFGVAGRCGLGALSAAAEQNVDGIGVDADQASLGDHILASALKRIDVGVYQTVQAAQAGSLTGGDTVFDVASGGVGLGEVSADVPAEIIARVQAMEQRIASGALTDIPTEVG